MAKFTQSRMYEMLGDISKKKTRAYKQGGEYLSIQGENHRVYKNANGDIMVNHPQEDKGKWDTINLTDKANANTIAEGVAATKKWHRENPMKQYAAGGAYYDDSRDAWVSADGKVGPNGPAYNNSGLQKFAKGGEPCPDGFEYIDGNCIEKSPLPLENCEDGRCEETDQIQHILDEGSYIPKKNVNIMWDVVDASEGYKTDYAGDFNRDPKNARNIWTSKGAQALSKRLGMYGPEITNVGNCMWSAGMGYQCLPETKGKISLMPFESNDKFINAVNKGTVPFSRVAKTHDPNFASQETGMLQQGDIINFKGGHNSHAMTFSNYNDDGTPIFLDSNGQESNFGWNRGMWPQIVPNKENVAYVSRFNPEKFYEKDIKILEEKARTNPTMIEKEYGGLQKFVTGGASSCPIGQHWDGIKCVPDYEPYSPYKQIANNALSNTVTGVNAKIAETQRKGMSYQSTADELKVLNKQKEKLKAEEAKRKTLENQEKIRQQQLRTVGSDNTRIDNSIVENNTINIQDPFVQAETITKNQKAAASQLVNSGDFAKHFPKEWEYYLSKENSNRQGGPLTMEELALQQIRTNPDFFKTLEERKYKDFQNREQKMYDEMPWYMKGINTINALATDPLTTLERGLLYGERPLAFQGLQSTDASIVGDDARFYDRTLNRDENVLNNTLNYINPFRAASSAGQNLQQGDYGDAVVDFATIIPMLKGAKLGFKGLNAAMRVSPTTLLKGAGSNVLANASPLVQATANKATVGNLLTLYGGYEAGAHNFPNAFDAYGKGDWKTGNKELFMGALGATPLALEALAGARAGKILPRTVNGMQDLTSKPSPLMSQTSEFAPVSAASNSDDTKRVLDIMNREPGYEYSLLSKEEAEALKLANPEMRTAKMNSVVMEYVPDEFTKKFPLSAEGQQQAFDDATDFALNWGITDPKALETLGPKLKEIENTSEEIKKITSSPTFNKVNQQVSDINHQILQEYLTSKNITIDDFLNNSDVTSDFQPFYDKKIAEITALDPDVSIAMQRRSAFQTKIDNFRTQRDQLTSEVATTKESLIDPVFKEKVINLYKEAGYTEDQIPKDAFLDEWNKVISDFNKDRFKLVDMNQHDPLSESSFANLPDSDQMYLANNWKDVHGVRTDESTITLGSTVGEPQYYTVRKSPEVKVTHVPIEPPREYTPWKPWTWKNKNFEPRTSMQFEHGPYPDEPTLVERKIKRRRDPEAIAGTHAHEIGHDYQKFYKNWGKLISKYDPDMAYYTTHADNKLAERFKNAMIEGEAKNVDTGAKQGTTWASAPIELHSELMKARYELSLELRTRYPNMSQKEIVEFIKHGEANNNAVVFDSYFKTLNKHFKETTPMTERRDLIKLLPMAIPAIGLGLMEGMNSETPQNKYGGNVKTLSKFIRK